MLVTTLDLKGIKMAYIIFSPATPNDPTITSLISTYPDQLTVTWTSVPTATSYYVSINDSINTMYSVLSIGAPQYTFTGLTNNTDYIVSVVAINCAGSSSPATSTGRTGETKACICMTSNNVNKRLYRYEIVSAKMDVTYVFSRFQII